MPTPFKFFGIAGLTAFLSIELSRSYRMYKITKWKESFLTPIYDWFYMTLVIIGLMDALLHKEKFGV